MHKLLLVIGYWVRSIIASIRSHRLILPTMIFALSTMACATTADVRFPEGNTCDASGWKAGFPGCLPPSGQFCENQRHEEEVVSTPRRDAQFIAQGLSLFPSKQALGAGQPVCPPNATRLVQEQDVKDAREGARVIGHTVGRVLTICERIVQDMTRQPENVLAGWNFVDPETLEAAFLKCTSELDTLPAIPQYEDVWLAEAAAKGFAQGYGDGVTEIAVRLLLLDLAIATIETMIVPGMAYIEVAVTRGIRASLNLVRRMPIFIPGAAGGAGAFLRSAPRIAQAVVEGSARVLARNMAKLGKVRLPGEFAHHIVAHGDMRAQRALNVLKKFGIQVDEAVNGVFLPGYKTSPNPFGKVVHGNLHTNAYYIAVNQSLEAATTSAEAIQTLRAIAWKLEHGLMP